MGNQRTFASLAWNGKGKVTRSVANLLRTPCRPNAPTKRTRRMSSAKDPASLRRLRLQRLDSKDKSRSAASL
jgi:hypothetical protein